MRHLARFLAAIVTLCTTTEFLAADVQYTVTALGTLGGSVSDGNAINADGTAVADASDSSGVFHAVVFDHGAVIDLGLRGGSSSLATAINNNGDAVGMSYHNGFYIAFQYVAGQVSELNTIQASAGN